jgi:hypothetical protein
LAGSGHEQLHGDGRVPRYETLFYFYLLPPTGIGESPDLAKAYSAAWNSAPTERYYEYVGLRGAWDEDLPR